MKLSIIIINYNTPDHIKRCLQSIKQVKDNIKKEVIVIDNASIDQSVRMIKSQFPWVKLIRSDKNLGFAGGNNLGLKQAQGKYILLLNSDTRVLKNTFKAMIDYMDQNPEVGVSTCRVELTSGKLDPACHRGFPTPWNAFTYFSGLEKLFPRFKPFAGYHQGWKDLNIIHEIDCPVGAFFLTRKKIIDKVGLLDERFFIYAEDIDWAFRIQKAGHKIMYVPATKIIHYKKASGRKKTQKGKVTQDVHKIRRTTSYYFFETMKQFYNKHYKNKYPFIVRWLVLSGIWLISKVKK